MATQAQLSANRNNALRSTGPRSAVGKAKAAMNAVSHQLTAVKVVAGVEDRPLFEALRGQLQTEWRPGSVLEVMLVDRMAELLWQLRRVAGVEVQVIERMPVPRPPGMPPEIYPMAAAMARDLAKPNPTLLRVQMYQNRLERTLHRTLAELRTLQIHRQLQDERDDLVEDEESELLPAPLPEERQGAGMERQSAIPEKAAEKGDANASSPCDAPQPLGTSSPHLTSPEGEGPEAENVFEKTNPILGVSGGRAEGSAVETDSIAGSLIPSPGMAARELGRGLRPGPLNIHTVSAPQAPSSDKPSPYPLPAIPGEGKDGRSGCAGQVEEVRHGRTYMTGQPRTK